MKGSHHSGQTAILRRSIQSAGVLSSVPGHGATQIDHLTVQSQTTIWKPEVTDVSMPKATSTKSNRLHHHAPSSPWDTTTTTCCTAFTAHLSPISRNTQRCRSNAVSLLKFSAFYVRSKLHSNSIFLHPRLVLSAFSQQHTAFTPIFPNRRA